MNAATFRKAWGLEAFASACARRRLKRISVWGDQIEQVGVRAAKRLLRDAGLSPFGYNRAGPVLAADPGRRRTLFAAAMNEIDRAAEIGADHVLLFTGGLPEGSKDLNAARRDTVEIFQQLLEHARNAGIALAVEPLHPMLCGDRSCIHTLSHANDICDTLGPGIGIVVDVYHVWWDERIEADIKRAGAANRILGFHVSDWLVPTKHVLTDRGLMGDGIIDLNGIWKQLLAAGYDGPIEVEIFSEHWWAQDPDDVLDLALERCRSLFDGGSGGVAN